MIVDVDFAHAIRFIAGILRDADANAALRKAASRGETGAVLDHLNSDKELGAEEREMLRELLAGELGRPKGRSLRATEIKHCCDAIEAFRREIVTLKTGRKLTRHQKKTIEEKAIEIVQGNIPRTANLRAWLKIPKVLGEELRERRKLRAFLERMKIPK
jgi:hypothetical protein